MLYLLYALLNIALIIFFVVTCFRATRLVRESFGLFAAFIFAFGLLSFIGRDTNDSNDKAPNASPIKTWHFTLEEERLKRSETFSIDIVLEKNSFSKNMLVISYGKDKQGQFNIPISAVSSASGFVSGTTWKPTSIIVNRTADNKFEYEVDGVVIWQLLGATIYTQAKEYRGLALPK